MCQLFLLSPVIRVLLKDVTALEQSAAHLSPQFLGRHCDPSIKVDARSWEGWTDGDWRTGSHGRCVSERGSLPEVSCLEEGLPLTSRERNSPFSDVSSLNNGVKDEKIHRRQRTRRLSGIHSPSSCAPLWTLHGPAQP